MWADNQGNHQGIHNEHRWNLDTSVREFMFAISQQRTRIPVILDHESATAKIESVKTLYPVLYDYIYFGKECFWEKHAKNTF